MADDAVLKILKAIQERLSKIEGRLGNIETSFIDMRAEMDGQFQLMMSRGSKADGLEIVVAALGKRVTALERRS